MRFTEDYNFGKKVRKVHFCTLMGPFLDPVDKTMGNCLWVLFSLKESCRKFGTHFIKVIFRPRLIINKS